MRSYTVTVSGVPYTVKVIPTSDNEKLKSCNGFCDKTTKTIVVDDCTTECDLGKPRWYVDKCIRHELVHAFMFEPGLAEKWEHRSYG